MFPLEYERFSPGKLADMEKDRVQQAGQQAEAE
jgi:hypothetical protein